MGQLTIYLDDDTGRILKRSIKSSGESASKFIAEAIRKRVRSEWPAEIRDLLGSWKNSDFPAAKTLRKGYGRDVKRETF